MTGAVTVNASIDVPDLASGLRFYGRVFGFTETARPFPTMAIVDAGNTTLCMHEKPAGKKPTPAAAPARSYDRHWTPVHLDMHVAKLGPLQVGHGFCVIATSPDKAQSGE